MGIAIENNCADFDAETPFREYSVLGISIPEILIMKFLYPDSICKNRKQSH
jgi:hypothetical protein